MSIKISMRVSTDANASKWSLSIAELSSGTGRNFWLDAVFLFADFEGKEFADAGDRCWCF